MHSAVAVATVVAAWIGLAIAIVRRAEIRAGAGVAPTGRTLAVGAAAAGAAALALASRPGPQALTVALACAALVVAAAGDARTGYLFDGLTFPAAVVVASLAIAAGDGARAAGGVLLLVGGFGAVVAFSRGRMMGLGDVKAMYALGAAFGPVESGVALFAACLSGVAVATLAGKFARGAEIRFGPHLAFGSVVAAVTGTAVAAGLGVG